MPSNSDPTFLKFLDISRQSVGYALTVDQCRRMKADGHAGLIVQLWSGVQQNPYAAETLANSLEAGLLIAGYTALNGSRGGEEAVTQARIACGTNALFEKLSFLAIDCEIDGILPATIDGAITRTLQYHQRPVIYTAYWWWVGRFGNPRQWSTVPLWVAFYDGDPDFDFPNSPFGGWDASIEIAEQYTDTQEFSYGGPEFGADVNAFRASFLDIAPGTTNGLVELVRVWKEDMADSIKRAADLHENQVLNKLALAGFALRQIEKSKNWSKLLGG